MSDVPTASAASAPAASAKERACDNASNDTATSAEATIIHPARRSRGTLKSPTDATSDPTPDTAIKSPARRASSPRASRAYSGIITAIKGKTHIEADAISPSIATVGRSPRT